MKEKEWSMRISFLWGPVFLTIGRSENDEHVGPGWGHFLKNIEVVNKNVPGPKCGM